MPQEGIKKVRGIEEENMITHDTWAGSEPVLTASGSLGRSKLALNQVKELLPPVPEAGCHFTESGLFQTCK